MPGPSTVPNDSNEWIYPSMCRPREKSSKDSIRPRMLPPFLVLYYYSKRRGKMSSLSTGKIRPGRPFLRREKNPKTETREAPRWASRRFPTSKKEFNTSYSHHFPPKEPPAAALTLYVSSYGADATFAFFCKVDSIIQHSSQNFKGFRQKN